jgi:cell division protein ZapA (FtsZ GTPase activity inhibitor)
VDSGSADKKLVRVTIFQQPYTLRSSGEPGETEALAQTVDELMNNIAARTAANDSTRVAVLTSLHLADRVRSLERELETVRRRLDQLDRRLASLLPLEPGPRA